MDNVELKDFVAQALVEIAQGIQAANQTLANPEKSRYEVFVLRSNKGDNAKIPGVRFDVSVVVSKKQTDKAGFFVTMASIGGGGSVEKGQSGDMSHRIQFEIGIEHNWH